MSFYQDFTSARTTTPDLPSLIDLLKSSVHPSATAAFIGLTTYRIKKSTVFTPQEIISCQAIIDTAPATSHQLTAQSIINNMPIFEKALLLTLLDQINVLRTQLGLVTITVQQAITAVRNKAGTL